MMVQMFEFGKSLIEGVLVRFDQRAQAQFEQQQQMMQQSQAQFQALMQQQANIVESLNLARQAAFNTAVSAVRVAGSRASHPDDMKMLYKALYLALCAPGVLMHAIKYCDVPLALIDISPVTVPPGAIPSLQDIVDVETGKKKLTLSSSRTSRLSLAYFTSPKAEPDNAASTKRMDALSVLPAKSRGKLTQILKDVKNCTGRVLHAVVLSRIPVVMEEMKDYEAPSEVVTQKAAALVREHGRAASDLIRAAMEDVANPDLFEWMSVQTPMMTSGAGGDLLPPDWCGPAPWRDDYEGAEIAEADAYMNQCRLRQAAVGRGAKVAGRSAGLGTVAAAYGYLGIDSPIDTWQADVVVTQPGQILGLLGSA